MQTLRKLPTVKPRQAANAMTKTVPNLPPLSGATGARKPLHYPERKLLRREAAGVKLEVRRGPVEGLPFREDLLDLAGARSSREGRTRPCARGVLVDPPAEDKSGHREPDDDTRGTHRGHVRTSKDDAAAR